MTLQRNPDPSGNRPPPPPAPFLAEGTTVVFATGAQTNVSIPPERFAEALSLAMVR